MLPTPVRRTAVTAGAALCTLVLAAGTAQADLPPDQLRAVTDRYLYETSLDEFHTLSTEQPYRDQLNWSSDSCSFSPDHPWAFDFAISCDRHDFGYRNYPKQDRFNEDTRLRIDNNFRDDLSTACGPQRACRATADLYYFAVRQFGGVSNSTADALRRAGITRAKIADTQAKAESQHGTSGTQQTKPRNEHPSSGQADADNQELNHTGN